LFVGLETSIELAFHRRHIDDVPVMRTVAQHQGFETCVEHEGRDRVHKLHFEQFHRRHVREEIPFYTGRRVDAAGAAEVLA